MEGKDGRERGDGREEGFKKGENTPRNRVNN